MARYAVHRNHGLRPALAGRRPHRVRDSIRQGVAVRIPSNNAGNNHNMIRPDHPVAG